MHKNDSKAKRNWPRLLSIKIFKLAVFISGQIQVNSRKKKAVLHIPKSMFGRSTTKCCKPQKDIYHEHSEAFYTCFKIGDVLHFNKFKSLRAILPHNFFTNCEFRLVIHIYNNFRIIGFWICYIENITSRSEFEEKGNIFFYITKLLTHYKYIVVFVLCCELITFYMWYLLPTLLARVFYFKSLVNFLLIWFLCDIFVLHHLLHYWLWWAQHLINQVIRNQKTVYDKHVFSWRDFLWKFPRNFTVLVFILVINDRTFKTSLMTCG